MRGSRRAGMGVLDLFGVLVVMVGAAFAFYFYVENRAAEGKRTQTIRRLEAVQEALARYAVDCGGVLPTQKQGLSALVSPPERPPLQRSWAGPYLADAEALKDAWGRPLKYYCPGGADRAEPTRPRPYDLASFGRDGQEGGKGLDRDIRSWDRATQAP